MSDRQALENATGDLFGQLWAPFDDKLFEESVGLFARRLDLAGFDRKWFEGKSCLDAGCGGGRNAIAMARLGASQVVGIDLGKQGLEDARKRAASASHSNIRFEYASILDIPLPDASMDIVWCAGVLMITDDPDRALDELTRVLRPGGKLYLLVYATEGIRWPLIQLLRPLAELIGMDTMEKAIVASGLPANKRRTYLDDLYCPRLDFYDWPRLRRMLEKRGMTSIERWGPNVRLDHEHDLVAYREDLRTLGEMFAGGKKIELGLKRELFARGLEMITASVESIISVTAAVAAKKLSPGDAERAVVGQGHHRVLATKR